MAEVATTHHCGQNTTVDGYEYDVVIIMLSVPLTPQDLSRLGRDIRKVVIIDNSPQSYIFHPDNAVSGKTERFSDCL